MSASVDAIAHLARIGTPPTWSLAVIALNGLVIYGLVAYVLRQK